MRSSDGTSNFGVVAGGDKLFVSSGRFVNNATVGGNVQEVTIDSVSNLGNGGSPKVQLTSRIGSGDTFAAFTVCVAGDRNTARVFIDAEV